MKIPRNIKLAGAAALAVLALILVLQNMETVETQVFWMELPMPRALLLLITLVIGFAIGLATATLLGRRR